jgi:hypothetical protein
VKLSTTSIAVWQDWVSAVKVGKNTNGNVEANEPGGPANYSGSVATLLKSACILARLFCSCSKMLERNRFKAKGLCLKSAYSPLQLKGFFYFTGHSPDRSDGARGDSTCGFNCWADRLTRGVALEVLLRFAQLSLRIW